MPRSRNGQLLAEKSPHGSFDNDDHAARVARKRATDRKSQRNHRERRRAYIRDLEAKVAVLTQAGSTDERLAALQAENETLRVRCNLLESKLGRIRTIACETEADDVGEDEDEPDPNPDARADADITTTSATTVPLHTPVTHTSTPALYPLPLDELDATFDVPSFDAQESSSNLADGLLHATAADTVIDASHEPQAATCSLALSEVALGLPADLDLTLGSFNYMPLQDVQNVPILRDKVSLATAALLPRYSRPQGIADRFLHAMLEEATAEHQSGQFDTSIPSLKRLLNDGPADILSFRLFHYIKGYGALPLHWFLAIFWVQYLYLRWHILKSAESYALVPRFLRPTSLECAIPHRISINMFVWPEIRHACIRDALTVNPENVGIALLQDLSPNWQPWHGTSNDLSASMDIYRMIEEQAGQFDFWKVETSPLHVYSQIPRGDPRPER